MLLRLHAAFASLAAAVAIGSYAHDVRADERTERPLVVPVVLAATGVTLVAAGAIVAATAPDLPSTCDTDTKACIQQPGESADAFASDQDRAGRAHDQPTAGWLLAGVGGMLVAAGVLTYVFGSERPSKTMAGAPLVAPFAAAHGGGLATLVRF
jgi:hypothetical protein